MFGKDVFLQNHFSCSFILTIFTGLVDMLWINVYLQAGLGCSLKITFVTTKQSSSIVFRMTVFLENIPGSCFKITLVTWIPVISIMCSLDMFLEACLWCSFILTLCDVYPAFSLVELLHCCPLIGRELHALKGPIIGFLSDGCYANYPSPWMQRAGSLWHKIAGASNTREALDQWEWRTLGWLSRLFSISHLVLLAFWSRWG